MKLLLGPPCSGKSEIADFIAHEFGYTVINIDMAFRRRAKKDPHIRWLLSSGDIIPLDVIHILIEDEIALKKLQLKSLHRVILEGYPTTLKQAKELWGLPFEGVFWLDCPKDESIRRMVNLYEDSDKDSYQLAKIRYNAWEKEVMPIYRHFKLRGSVYSFNTTLSKKEVRGDIGRRFFKIHNYSVYVDQRGDPMLRYGPALDWEWLDEPALISLPWWRRCVINIREYWKWYP